MLINYVVINHIVRRNMSIALYTSSWFRRNLDGYAEEQEKKTEYGDKGFHDERIKTWGETS